MMAFTLPPNKPIVGDRVFTGEAGIFIAGWMKYNLGAEAYLPEIVGNRHGVFLGKKSGVHSVQWKLKELGMEADKGHLDRILAEVKKRSEEKKSNIDDAEFRSIVDSLAN